MASQPNDNQIFPSTSSPTPVRDSQPHHTSPTTTVRGTQRGHAELDTPPPGAQPAELKRSDRVRNLSLRGQDSARHTKKPVPGHSNAPQPETPAEPDPTPAEPKPKSRPDASQRSQKRKRPGPPSQKFDGEEESTDEEQHPLIRLKLPRKRTKARVESPPPKQPGHRVALARQAERNKQQGGGNKRPPRLNANATESIFKLFGADPNTTSARTINQKVLSLSDHPPTQAVAQGGYTQVRCEPSAPLSPLSKKRGGYHRDVLLALGHPEPSNSKRRLDDEEEPAPSKRARIDGRLDSYSSAAENPAFRGDILSLPSFGTQPERASVSSTQRATVRTAVSQPEPRRLQARDRFGFGAGLTPIPEPKDIYSKRAAARRASSPAPRVNQSPDPPRLKPRPPSPKRRPPPPPEPRAPSGHHAPPRQPVVLVPGTPSRSPTPERRAPKPLPTKQSRSDTRNVPPPPRKKPATTTESESESEPEPASKPKPKRTARQTEVRRAGARSTRAIAGPSTQRQRASPGPSTRHYDVQAIVNRLGDVLNGGEDEDGNESDDQVLDQVIQLLLRRQQRARPPSSRHEHTRRPSSHHEHTEPSSSRPHHQSGSSTKRRTGRHATSGNEDPDQHSGSSSAQSGSESPVDLSRNGLARYPGKRGKVASHAIPHLLAVAIRKGIFQSQDIYFKWARREYIRAWKKLYPKIKYKRPSRHLLRLNLNADEDYYMHQHVYDVISEALFSRPDSPLVLHHKDFVLLPLPTVAFVLMMMQDCLQEWDTGCLRVRENQFKQQKAVFDAHLHGLETYKGKASARLARRQSKWFLAGMEFAGISVVEGSGDEELDTNFCQPVSQACFIRSDSESEHELTPEPEREPTPEPEYNEHGCMTAQSKGKGKAKGLVADDLDGLEDDFEDDADY
ncbi:hypothetical protein FRC09_005747 [Ceratobasidium sp. 395]|nr:hypothetical protein FRC09_005747 [Ceratobasidium sp. 395]